MIFFSWLCWSYRDRVWFFSVDCVGHI